MSGGSASINIGAPTGCSWSASTADAWISIVSSSAQALASVGLGLAGASHAAVLGASSVVLAGTYLGAAWHVRRAYLDTLIEGLESGRLRWLEVGSVAARYRSTQHCIG